MSWFAGAGEDEWKRKRRKQIKKTDVDVEDNMRTGTERNSSSLLALIGDTNNEVAAKHKVLYQIPATSVRGESRESLPKNKGGELHGSETSNRVLERIQAEEVQSSVSCLKPRDTQIGELNSCVENQPLLLRPVS